MELQLGTTFDITADICKIEYTFYNLSSSLLIRMNSFTNRITTILFRFIELDLETIERDEIRGIIEVLLNS